MQSEPEIQNCIVVFVDSNDEMVNCQKSYFENTYQTYKYEKNTPSPNSDWKTFWTSFKQKCSLRKSPSNEKKVKDIKQYIFRTSIVNKKDICSDEDKVCKCVMFVKLPYYVKGNKESSDTWKKNLWSVIVRQIQEITLRNKFLSYTIVFSESTDDVEDLKTCTDDQFLMYTTYQTFKYCNKPFNFIDKLE